MRLNQNRLELNVNIEGNDGRSLSMTKAKLKGVEVDLSENRIRQIAGTYAGNPKIRNLYTDVDGKLVPPKWLIIVVLNLHHEDLISYNAVDVLNQLGFQTYSNKRFKSQRQHKIKYKPVSY